MWTEGLGRDTKGPGTEAGRRGRPGPGPRGGGRREAGTERAPLHSGRQLGRAPAQTPAPGAASWARAHGGAHSLHGTDKETRSLRGFLLLGGDSGRTSGARPDGGVGVRTGERQDRAAQRARAAAGTGNAARTPHPGDTALALLPHAPRGSPALVVSVPQRWFWRWPRPLHHVRSQSRLRPERTRPVNSCGVLSPQHRPYAGTARAASRDRRRVTWGHVGVTWGPAAGGAWDTRDPLPANRPRAHPPEPILFKTHISIERFLLGLTHLLFNVT